MLRYKHLKHSVAKNRSANDEITSNNSVSQIGSKNNSVSQIGSNNDNRSAFLLGSEISTKISKVYFGEQFSTFET